MRVGEGPAAHRTIRLLDYDPELGMTMRAERWAQARRTAQATLVEVPRGAYASEALAGGRSPAYGVLLLDGLANRTVVLDGVVSAQLLGRGDLVRIGGDAAEALIDTAVHWIVLEPLAVALLDEQFLLTVRRWPEIVAGLFARLAAQEERRDVHRALSQLSRVEDRIHALLWLLAERWGHVTPEGVVVQLHLTHELIGQLVGAKRPTVSLALRALEERSSVRRRSDGGWLLEQAWTAPPRGELTGLDGAGIVAYDEYRSAGRTATLDHSQPAIDEIRRRVERMRRQHARLRDDGASTARVRERSSDLHERA